MKEKILGSVILVAGIAFSIAWLAFGIHIIKMFFSWIF